MDSLEVPSLTKAMVVEVLATRMDVNTRASGELVEAFFELIQERLCSGEDVKLVGFGHFDVRKKAARVGRNPRTGEAVLISPRQVVTFSASPTLKKRLASGRTTEPTSHTS
ncbi:integration host factor subunit alpha [Hydrogenophaga sp. BPS33]|uniref:integration host factor subunit alpha n=1 Tax=Hydrogenophaga sp. BPS33 TaxID=2651974 RepID=UPI001F26CA13|nr:integration host factor subunit alpha [Hydrogenophaga sp. BPS33]